MEGLAVSLYKRAHGDEVLISDLPYVCGSKRQQRLGAAGSCHEFDFHCVRREHVNDRTEVAAAQASSRNVMRECDGIEQLEHGLPRICGKEPRYGLLRLYEPNRLEVPDLPIRPGQLTTDLVLLAVRAWFRWDCFSGLCDGKQVVPQFLPVLLRVSERTKDDCLEPANRMAWRKQLVADLARFDNGFGCIWEHARV